MGRLQRRRSDSIGLAAGSSMAGTVPVMRLSEYVLDYQQHPEAEATDWNGNPAGPDTIGLLRRLPLQSKRLIRIGKEVDRLAGDEGATLETGQPVDTNATSSRWISTIWRSFRKSRRHGILV